MQHHSPCGHASAICLSGLGEIRTEAVNAARGSIEPLMLRRGAVSRSFHTQYGCLIALFAQPLSPARENRTLSTTAVTFVSVTLQVEPDYCIVSCFSFDSSQSSAKFLAGAPVARSNVIDYSFCRR